MQALSDGHGWGHSHLGVPRYEQKWMSHYRAQNVREPFDYAAQLIAFRRGDPDWYSVQNPDWIAAQRTKNEP